MSKSEQTEKVTAWLVKVAAGIGSDEPGTAERIIVTSRLLSSDFPFFIINDESADFVIARCDRFPTYCELGPLIGEYLDRYGDRDAAIWEAANIPGLSIN